MKHTFRYLLRDPAVAGATVALDRADAHHLTRVVRRRVGDPVEMIDPSGRVWPATVVQDGENAAVRLAAAPVEGPPPAPVVLYQGLTEWGRLDTLVEKCAEIGVPRIVFLVTARTRRPPDRDTWRRRRERMLRVAEAAARQSGRSRLPAVEGPVGVEEALAAGGTGDTVMLDPRGEEGLADVLARRDPRDGPVRLLVGPDAGFSDEEVAAADRGGVPVCSLGPGTLRAETAGLVAVAVALTVAGALSPSSAGPASVTGSEPSEEAAP